MNALTVEHQPDALVITLPTSSPAALQEGLMKGITRSLKSHLNDEDKTLDDSRHVCNLLTLLEAMLPIEQQLDKAHGS